MDHGIADVSYPACWVGFIDLGIMALHMSLKNADEIQQ